MPLNAKAKFVAGRLDAFYHAIGSQRIDYDAVTDHIGGLMMGAVDGELSSAANQMQ